MNNNYQLRFSDAPWAPKLKNTFVELVGLGGIGSWIALLLSKMGIRYLIMYDMDTVEEHNIAGQLFGPFHIGRNKAEAVREIITPLIPPYGPDDNVVITPRQERYPSNGYVPYCSFVVNHIKEKGFDDVNLVMITALDSMSSRLACVSSISSTLEHLTNLMYVNPEVRDLISLADQQKTAMSITLVDPRMSAEIAHIVTIKHDITFFDLLQNANNRNHISTVIEENVLAKWQRYMFPDDEVEEGPCSYRSTTFASMATASTTVSQMVNAICGRPLEENIGLHLPSGMEIPVKAWRDDS